jgi:hypothetical protein
MCRISNDLESQEQPTTTTKTTQQEYLWIEVGGTKAQRYCSYGVLKVITYG